MALSRATLRASVLAGFSAAACGGRSGLFDVEPIASAGSSEPEPPAQPDDAPMQPQVPRSDPEPDPEPEAPCQASMCPDDGDTCNGVELCDPDTNLCIHADPPKCDDGLSCNGVETCDPRLGCVAGEPVVCEAPAHCDENVGRCACDGPYVAPDCNIKTALFAYFGEVRELAEERGVLWVTTSTGLWALDFADTPSDPSDDTWSHFDELSSASDTGNIAIDQTGTKWFAGAYDRQLVRFDDGGTPLDQENDTWYFYRFQPTFSPRAVGLDAAGNAWLGRVGETLTFSDSGTAEDRSDDQWRTVSELDAPQGLVDLSSVDTISSEPLGVVWLASSAGGLFAYDAGADQFFELTRAQWPRVYAMAWEGETLWLSVGSDEELLTPGQLASVQVHDSVLDALDNEWKLHAAPHAIGDFDVDSGGHVWVSDPTSGFSCLDLESASWSEWNVDQSVRSILTRSPTDLWFGAQSVFHLDHGGSCAPQTDGLEELVVEQTLRSPARDVAIEGAGIWLATDRGVDYLDAGGTPFDPRDDRWAHFDEQAIPGLEGLQGVLVGPDGVKYFWGEQRVFAFDDQGTPWDTSDDSWVAHDTELPLWVSGIVDPQGILLVVARTGLEAGDTPRIIVFDPAGTPRDDSDDVVTTIDSYLPGMGRNMTLDTEGEVWVGTETETYGGNLFHWDRKGTPVNGEDDVWTPVREEDGRVWKLEADPTGGVWGTLGEGVFQFYDGGTPTDLSDDYWHVYSELGSAMDIGPGGVGWFRMPGGAGILDVGGTPRDPSDDVARVLLSPDALRFQSDLYTNGTIDEEGRFWVVDEYVQVFEYVN